MILLNILCEVVLISNAEVNSNAVNVVMESFLSMNTFCRTVHYLPLYSFWWNRFFISMLSHLRRPHLFVLLIGMWVVVLQYSFVAAANQRNCVMHPAECRGEIADTFLPCFSRVPGTVRNKSSHLSYSVIYKAVPGSFSCTWIAVAINIKRDRKGPQRTGKTPQGTCH